MSYLVPLIAVVFVVVVGSYLASVPREEDQRFIIVILGIIVPLIIVAIAGEAKTTSTPTTQAQVTYVSESVLSSKKKVNEELGKVRWWEIVRRRPTAATKDHMISSYDVLIIQNIRVNSFTMKMEILLEPTSIKIMVERFYTLAGNPVREILLKLNLPDHRKLKDGGEVLKLKNFKKDATLKLSKSTNQEWYEHVGLEVTRSQDDKVKRWQNEIMLG
ncbi:hypothetical protein Tco_0637223 [Tanacetum coccineum]